MNDPISNSPAPEGCPAPTSSPALDACEQLVEHCKQAHRLLAVAEVAITQAADLAAFTETTDSQHHRASQLLCPLERASRQIREFLSPENENSAGTER